jgi:uncharacterized phiE125 gp8 family phage protein
MPTDRITDATVEPLTIEQAKRHLREELSDADNDADIGTLITAARLDAEARLQRTLISTAWRLTLDAFPLGTEGYGDGAVRLAMGRVIAVQSLKYVDPDGVLQTLASDQYRVDLAGDVARITPAYGLNWPTTQDVTAAVQVNYTAGYGTTAAAVPAPIVSWIKLAIGDLYEQRSRSAERPAVPMQFADGLLDPYRIWSL